MGKYFVITSLISLSAFAQKLQGVYEVPVNDNSLAPYATYQIEYESSGAEYGEAFTFTLPLELTGLPNTITIRKGVDPFTKEETYAGPKARGKCRRENKELVCEIKFTQLKIDPALVADVVHDQYDDSETAEKKLMIASHFSSEPRGILRYPLRGK